MDDAEACALPYLATLFADSVELRDTASGIDTQKLHFITLASRPAYRNHFYNYNFGDQCQTHVSSLYLGKLEKISLQSSKAGDLDPASCFPVPCHAAHWVRIRIRYGYKHGGLLSRLRTSLSKQIT